MFIRDVAKLPFLGQTLGEIHNLLTRPSGKPFLPYS